MACKPKEAMVTPTTTQPSTPRPSTFHHTRVVFHLSVAARADIVCHLSISVSTLHFPFTWILENFSPEKYTIKSACQGCSPLCLYRYKFTSVSPLSLQDRERERERERERGQTDQQELLCSIFDVTDLLLPSARRWRTQRRTTRKQKWPSCVREVCVCVLYYDISVPVKYQFVIEHVCIYN